MIGTLLTAAPASATGNQMIVPFDGAVTVTAGKINPNASFTDSVEVTQPTTAWVCNPCSTQPQTISLGQRSAGTEIVVAMYVQQTNRWYYSNNSADTALFLQTSPWSWIIQFEDYNEAPLDVEVDVGQAALEPITATGYGSGFATRYSPVCSTSRPVNCASGDFWHTFTDFDVPGRGPDLQLTRTYNSLGAATAGLFGFGWSSSYDSHLTVNADQSITIVEADGSAVTARPWSGGLVLPAWSSSTLTHLADGTYRFVRQAREIYTYSSAGKLLSIADPNGYPTTVTYNGSGRLTTVTDAGSRALTFTYNAAGQVTAVADSANRTVTYGYDAGGNLTSVTDAAGGVTAFGYDASHRMVTMRTPRYSSDGSLPAAVANCTATTGPVHVTSNHYDANGRVDCQYDPAGARTTFAYSGDNYSAAGGTTTIVDPNGNTQTQTYVNGQLTSKIDAAGSAVQATWSYTYDDTSGGITSITDPNSHTTRATYDTRGNPLTRTDALNRVTTYTYDTLNDVTSITEPKTFGTTHATTTMTYDSGGNLLTRATPLLSATGATTATRTTTYHYDDATHPGDVTSMTDPNGSSWIYHYDAEGYRDAETSPPTPENPSGNRTTYTYGPNTGYLLSKVSPRGNVTGGTPAAFTTTYTTDALGRVTQIEDPLGRHTQFAYDGDGNKTEETDGATRTTAFTYDADGRLTVTSRPDGTTLITVYDPVGNLTSKTDGAGRATTYTYNPANKLIATSDPLNRNTQFGYDLAGNQTTITDATGRITTRTYDDANHLTGIAYSDTTTPAVTYTYDAGGRRATMSDGTGTTTYSWDSIGRLSEVVSGAGRRLTYTRDLVGHVTQISSSFGYRAVNTYDGAGRQATVGNNAGTMASFTYDADNNLATITRADGTVEARTYNAADELTHQLDTTAHTVVLDLNYTYGTDGNLTSATTLAEAPNATETYVYDTNGRLHSDTPSAGTVSTVPTTYDYSDGDDLQQVALNANTTTAYTMDGAGQLTSASTPAVHVDFTNDQLGNRTGWTDSLGNHASYTYDQANRLAVAEGPPVTAINTQTNANLRVTYSYNGDGLRMSTGAGAKNRNPQVTQDTWDISGDLPMLVSSGVTGIWYGPAGLPIAQAPQSQNVVLAGVIYLHTDRQHSVRATTNDAGNTLATANYTPYGSPINTTAAPLALLGYAGEKTDAETGLIYLRARYYDPTTARFLTRDPAEVLTSAPYSYTSGNPLNRTDPSGLSWWNPFTWTPQTWDNIASVAAVSAAFIPGVGIVDLLALGAGVIGTGEHLGNHEWGSAALGAAGVGLTGFGYFEGVLVNRYLRAASLAANGYGYLSPRYEAEALLAAARSGRLSRLGALLGGGSFALTNLCGSR